MVNGYRSEILENFRGNLLLRVNAQVSLHGKTLSPTQLLHTICHSVHRNAILCRSRERAKIDLGIISNMSTPTKAPELPSLTQSHAHGDVRISHHFRKFLEADLAVVVEIRFHDGLVDNLLQLLVLQIAAHHHFEHDEQFPVADVPVSVDVVDFERKSQLLLLVALGAEGAQPGDELLEVDISAAVFVEDGDHAGREGVGRDLRKREEFISFDGAGVVLKEGGPGSEIRSGSPSAGVRILVFILCPIS